MSIQKDSIVGNNFRTIDQVNKFNPQVLISDLLKWSYLAAQSRLLYHFQKQALLWSCLNVCIGKLSFSRTNQTSHAPNEVNGEVNTAILTITKNKPTNNGMYQYLMAFLIDFKNGVFIILFLVKNRNPVYLFVYWWMLILRCFVENIFANVTTMKQNIFNPISLNKECKHTFELIYK